VLTGTRSGKTPANSGLTCANIARIDVRARRSRNFAQTVVKSEPTDASCAETTMNCGGIEETCGVTLGTIDAIGVMHGGTS
jgi:hypothetical protein